MRLNDFSVHVPQGAETSAGYVEISHGKHYTIRLRNDRFVECDALVEIDGKEIGTFRIPARAGVELERKPDDNGRFTFYRKGTKEWSDAELGAVDQHDLGLLCVTFTPALVGGWVYSIPRPVVVVSQPWTAPNTVDPFPGTAPYTGDPIPSPWITTCGVHDNNTTSVTTRATAYTLTTSHNAISANSCAGGTKPQACAGGTGLSGHSDQDFGSAFPINLDYAQQTRICLRLISRRSKQARPLTPTTRANPIPPPI